MALTRTHLYALASVGANWAPGDGYPDGDPRTRSHLFGIINVGPNWTPGDGYLDGDPRTRSHVFAVANAGPNWRLIDGFPDGDPRKRPHLYALAKVDTTTPTPHIWFLYPTYGREGWEFVIVGYGFGNTQGTYAGTVALNGLAVGVISWVFVAKVGTGNEINAELNIANPEHQTITAVVPVGAVSGLVKVTTDGP